MFNQLKKEESTQLLHKNGCREQRENERGRKETGNFIAYVHVFPQDLWLSFPQCNKLFLIPQEGNDKNYLDDPFLAFKLVGNSCVCSP